MDEFELQRALSWLLDENDCWGEDFIGTAIQCVKKQNDLTLVEFNKAAMGGQGK